MAKRDKGQGEDIQGQGEVAIASQSPLAGRYCVLWPAAGATNTAVQINGEIGLCATAEEAVAMARPLLGTEEHMLLGHLVVQVIGCVADFVPARDAEDNAE